MRCRVLLPVLTLALLALPAVAADRLTPRPMPTAAPVLATPAVPAADGRPLRPQAAFEPLPVVAPPPFTTPATSPPPPLPPLPPPSPPPEPSPAPLAVQEEPEPATSDATVPEVPRQPVAPAPVEVVAAVAATVSPPPVPARKPPTPAAASKRRVWATESVYVRAAPDPRARIVDGLATGDALDRLPGDEEEDGWVRVGRDGRPLGFVAGRYLSDAPPKPGRRESDCTLPDDLPDAPRQIAAPGTRMRALADAYMRAGPTCEARALDVLETGAMVTVTGHSDGWYEVRGQGWPRAYISMRLLTEMRGR